MFLTEVLEGKLIKDFLRDHVRDVKRVVENIRMNRYPERSNSEKVHTWYMRKKGMPIMLIGTSNCGGKISCVVWVSCSQMK